jgi:hypothetical protein
MKKPYILEKMVDLKTQNLFELGYRQMLDFHLPLKQVLGF